MTRAAPLLCLLLAAAAPASLAAQAGEPEFRQKVRTAHPLSEPGARGIALRREATAALASGDVLVGSSSGVVRRAPSGSHAPFPGDRMLPWNEITVIAEQSPGIVWLGTRRGAVRWERGASGSKVEYFASRRWLPDDRVTGIGFERGPDEAVWIETAAGASRIAFERMTLEEKARRFQERVRARHVRHGLTSSSRLPVAGDLSSSRTASSDNDGLWTAMYVAAECFRWKATGAADARDNARRGVEALQRLEAISGIPGFPARSFVELGREQQPSDGEWHATADGRWSWKGDTSSDEIVGHYFGYAVYHDLVADAAERRSIAAVVDRITAHIVDHGYHLVDVDGKPTRWGWWAPDEIWRDPDETGLRALHLLSHLAVAHHVTGKARYRETYLELARRHRYAELTRNQKISVPGHVNHSDDELAFLSYYPLLQYETDPALRRIYVQSLERSWRVEQPERNPLWNFIYAAGSGAAEFGRADAIETLERIPMDLVTWTVSASHRLDVAIDASADRFGLRQSHVVLPPDERPTMKWNGNPYALDGGDGGRSEDDGAFFLLPYWMGRHHGLLGTKR